MTESAIPFRIAKRIRLDDSGCWLWDGAMSAAGYAVSRGREGAQYVHRLMFAFAYGEIPLGHQVHHICEVRSCVNPAHLVAVTQREHNQRHGYKHARLGVLARMANHPDWNWKASAA